MSSEGNHWRDVCRAISSKYPGRFLDDHQEAQQNARSGREAFLGYLPGPTRTLSSDGGTTVEIFANIVMDILEKKLGPEAILIAVPKKGISILTEMVERVPSLQKHPIVHEAELSTADIRNKVVLVIDDSVRRGVALRQVIARIRFGGAKSVVLATMLIGENGIRTAEKVCDDMVSPFPVTDDAFLPEFVRIIVPVMESLRKGTISDRAWVDFELRCDPERSPEKKVEDLLSAAIEMSITDVVLEVTRKNGLPPGFSATIEINERTKELIRAKIRKDFGSTAQLGWTKLRLYPCPGTRFSVRLYSILHPSFEGDPTRRFGSLVEASDWLLSMAKDELGMAMRGRGYDLVWGESGHLLSDTHRDAG